MINILIADDHPIVREGLKQVIAKAPDMTVADEALNGQEVLDKVRAAPFDVVILDFSMPGKSGLDVLKDLHRELPALPVLVLSMHPENQLATRVLKAGAAGYMTKESAPRDLVDAVRKIHQGGKYVSAALAESLAAALGPGAGTKALEELSDREFQVLCMIASGRTVQEIAGELSLSVKTVRTYRERVLAKMQLKNDVELTHYAIEHNLLQKASG